MVTTYNGRKYYHYKDYFKNNEGQLLHRIVWSDMYGPIEPGFVIHHKNEDKLDNRLENLECLPDREHKQKHSTSYKKGWTTKPEVTRVCEQCGKPYKTRSTYSTRCGGRPSPCINAYVRDRRKARRLEASLQPTG